jgi:hypothetical protein
MAIPRSSAAEPSLTRPRSQKLFATSHAGFGEAKGKSHCHMRNRAAAHGIDHDRAGAGKHEAESSQEFSD